MENKLVFKPTELTQYNWKKYVLNENRTYYWDKYEAEPDYLYNYYWNKYEIVPPSPTNQWNTYNLKYDFEPEYDENIVLQNWQSKHYWGWTHNNWDTSQNLRVLRNRNVLTDDYRRYTFDMTSWTVEGANFADVSKISEVQGAYLFLVERTFYESGNINTGYRRNFIPNGRYKGTHYLAKSLKDITQKTNLIKVDDIVYDNNHHLRSQADMDALLKSYILDGYIYSFQSKVQDYPYGYNYSNGYPGTYGEYEAYENGLIFGYSYKVNEDLWLTYKAQQVAAGFSPDYRNPWNLYQYTSATRGQQTPSGNYLNNPYLETDCQFNDVEVVVQGCFAMKNISVIEVLTPHSSIIKQVAINLDYQPYIVQCDDSFFAELCISHSLNYRYFSERNPEVGNVGVMNGFYETSDRFCYAKNAQVTAYTSSTPAKGTFNSYAYNPDINMYPQNGIYNNKWYVYIGETTLEEYSPGEMVEENVMSHFSNEYPQDGIQDDYYYVYQYWTRRVVDWLRGRYIGTATSSTYQYPQNGAYPNDLSDTTHYWYSFIRYVSRYTKGNYIEPVHSYIESAYPRNSYVIGDSWYVFDNSEQVLVGELTIDETKLMGGVNYTQEINPSEDLMIGAGGAAQVDFTIYAPDANAATQYLGKDFVYFVRMNSEQDWRKVGIFTLTTAELPDKQTAKIEGFDYIYKFDVNVDEWLDGLTFPMTLGNLFNSLCEYVGCEAYSTEFNNSNFVVNDNFEAVQITGRTILQYITEVSGGFCVAEPDGRIHIKQYSIPPTGTINLGNDSYVKYTHEIYNVPVITSVVVRKDDEDEGVESNV